MKRKNYEVENQGSHLNVAFSGFNVQDIFSNSFEAFKKLLMLKKINKPELAYPGLPVMSYSMHIQGDKPEVIFAEWYRRLIYFTESMKYLPLTLDMLYLHDDILRAKVSYRLICKKDKCHYSLKGIDPKSINLEKTQSGLRLHAKIDL